MARKPSAKDCPLSLAILSYYETNNERLLTPVFEALIPGLRIYAWKLGIKCPGQAAETAQKTVFNLLKLFRKHEYQPDRGSGQPILSGAIWRYAYQAMAFEARSDAIKNSKKPSYPSEQEDPFLALADKLIDEEVDPEQAFHQRQATETIASVTRAVLTLKPRHRELIILVFYKGWMKKDAGAKLGMSVTNLTQHLQRALTQIRKSLEEMGIEPTPEVYSALRNIDTSGLFEEAPKKLTRNQEGH